MAYHTIQEGGATVRVPRAAKVSKEMEVFYNPVMHLNRDISVLLLKVVGEERQKKGEGDKKAEGGDRQKAKEDCENGDGPDSGFSGFMIGSPLAGSGVRECRFLVELERGMIKEIAINDYSPNAVRLIKKNIELNENNLSCDEIEVSCDEANLFLLNSRGFSYIDLDPFGTPNPFLDAAIKRLQRNGILAVTATDTSSLAGTYPDACRRKYWAEPMRNHLMHEAGLRILIRKVQLIGAQYEKALIPIYSYAKDHYMRVFFLNERRKKAVDVILKKHQYMHYCKSCLSIAASDKNSATCCRKSTILAGPLWTGPLWDAKLTAAMAKENRNWAYGRPENQKFLDTLAAEAKAPEGLLGFFPINLVVKTLQKTPLKKEYLLGRKGVYPTHFEPNAIKAMKKKLLF